MKPGVATKPQTSTLKWVEYGNITNWADDTDGADKTNGSDGSNVADGADVETLHATSLQQQPPSPPTKNQTMANISPKQGSLSTILRSYKSAVTNHTTRLGFQFAWQSRFHDHIIRDDNEFRRIREYIINNPNNWTNDKFYK